MTLKKYLVNKGDIILVSFPFTNLVGSKFRPAVILYETSSNITACFITTQFEQKEPTDILLIANQTNGLKIDSLLRTSKIATIDKQIAKGILGTLSAQQID